MLKKSLLSLSLVVLSGALVGCWSKKDATPTEQTDKMAEAVAPEAAAEVVAAVDGAEQVVAVADASNPCADCATPCEASTEAQQA